MDRVDRKRPVEVIAHRGASGAGPENTMAAFARALDAGAHRIELDAQLTRDGKVVVFHDATVDRTTDGTGRLDGLDLEEVLRLDAGSWFSTAFAVERIPTLVDVLRWSAGRIPLNVELKVRGGGEPALALARAVAPLLDAEAVAETTICSSFDPVAAAELGRRCPPAEVALLWNGRTEPDPLSQAETIGARALHLPLSAIDGELLSEAHARGLAVRVYTVNTEHDLERALAAGVDGVFTDLPEAVLGWIRSPQR